MSTEAEKSTEAERIAEAIAADIAAELSAASMIGGTEADFRREAARILGEAAKKASLEITPRDEYSVASGRVDSLYNKLVIEYKAPGKLRETNEGRTNQDVIAQTKGYILNVATRQKREAHRIGGVVTDGRYFIFIRRFGESWAVDDPEPVNTASTEKFLRLLFALSTGAALVPENLIEDFGPKTLRAWRAVGALYQALHRHTSREKSNPLVGKLFEQWRIFFAEATDYKEWSARIESKKEFRDFVAGMKLDPKYVEAPKVFFALHTYYALLIKLVASLAAARFAGGSAEKPFSEFAGKEGDALRDAFIELERGGLFRQYGIRNFLEGDFFGWYAAAWDAQIEQAAGKLIQRLAEYDPGTLELAPENARDLLKNLYHSLLPKEIRHDLGEYYTPDWLAEHVIRQTLGDADIGDATKRVLDPACGSGTFLVLLIKFIKERAERKKQPPEKTLELVLQNVVGFDLNPLAVIAARTNYLLALGDLLRHRRGDIDIPVYQSDSILTPSRGSTLFDGSVYPIETAVGELRVPAAFAGRERLDALANELDQSVEDGISPDAFLARLAKSPAAALQPEELKATRKELLDLYSRLKHLHDNGLNGVWARIIKNAFAPLFIEPCHHIVGNPPWVNWENLPDRYRERTKSLWQRYGLFVHGGMDTILGKGKKDISMLMTYVAADQYLRKAGRLGFVVSQSLLKTSGSGEGFRRFGLPDGTPLGPVIADDMVTLNPFEGAANRTAVLVLSKGKKVEYPIPYVLWEKKESGRGSSIAFDATYPDVTARTARVHWEAEPVDPAQSTSPWLAWHKRALGAVRKVLGRSNYEAHEGSNTGGANAIYWVERTGTRPGGLTLVTNIIEGAKKKVTKTQFAVEADLLYPLLRGRDVSRWHAQPSAEILMMQDPVIRRGIPADIVATKHPKALSYLTKWKRHLESRAAFKRYYKPTDPWWSMFNVSDFTFSNWKVVWREQASQFTATVIGPKDKRPIVPDHKLMLVAVGSKAEAHYLCGALNSSPVRAAVLGYAVSIQLGPHILEHVRVPHFSARNHVHEKLSECSQQAHAAVVRGDLARLKEIETELDHWAAKLWDLGQNELVEIKASLEETCP